MLSIPGSAARNCEGLSRREWLRAGGLGALGLSLPELLRLEAARGATPARAPGRARSCIIVFLFGAPAHQDIWDMKPDAPREIRGEFGPIRSNVPGVIVGEHVPLLARQMDKLALVRSVTHPDNTHTVAMHYMLTGHRHVRPNTNPQNETTDFPTFGAVVQKLERPRGPLPSGISLNAPANQTSANNHIFPGFFAGFLGRSFDPLFVPQDPTRPDFQPFPAVADSFRAQYCGRRGLLAEVDRQRRTLERDPRQDWDASHARAFDLVTAPAARRAFDLSREPATVRQRYGNSAFGQGLLLARRLVESGVRLVTVNWARDDAFWDTHANNFNLLKSSLLPPFDLGFSALLEDLDQRGLLDETLVFCLGEFGRTPRINGQAGRDHWAACNSVLFAGGGVRGGQVFGSSDRWAAFPATMPVTPDDLAATVYHALGIDTRTTLFDSQQRPLTLSNGTPLMGLF